MSCEQLRDLKRAILDHPGPAQGIDQPPAREPAKEQARQAGYRAHDEERAVGQDVGGQRGKELEDKDVRGRRDKAGEPICPQGVLVPEGKKPEVHEQPGDQVHEDHQQAVSVARQQLDPAFQQSGDGAGSLLAGEADGQREPQDVQAGGPLAGAGKAEDRLKKVAHGIDVGAHHAAQGCQGGHHQQVTCRKIGSPLSHAPLPLVEP